MQFKKNSWPLILLFLGTSLGFTQAPEDFISIRFQTMSWEEPIKDIYYQSNEKEHLLFIPNASFSRVQQYTGPKEVVFYRKKVLEGVTIKTPVAMARMLAVEDGRFIFVFIKGSAEEERYNIYPIKYDDGMGRENQVTLVNLSKDPIAGRIDQEKFRLNAGQANTIDVSPNEGGNVMAQFLLETVHGWKPLYSNYWKVYIDKQVFAFIARPSNTSRHVTVRLVFQQSDV